MPVLVLDSHSRAAIETIQSLGRAGLEIDVAEEWLGCPAMKSRYAARKLIQPSQLVPEEFQRWLRAQDRVRHYELIVPSTEASLSCLRLLPESDSLRKRAVLPGNKALDVAVDKHQTWQLAKTLGVPAPESILVPVDPELDSPARYPLVLKPLRSKVVVDGKLQTVEAQIIHAESDYRIQVDRLSPYTPLLRQEYVVGRGIGAEFLFNRGKKVWHFLHERLHEVPLSGGASSYRHSIAPLPELLTDAERILTALEWHGVAMVEFRIDDRQQHWLLEINPRLWGSLALAIDAGVNFPWGLWLLAKGFNLPEQPSYRINYYTRDIRRDLEWFKLRMRAHNPRFTDSRFSSSTLELLRPIAGRESWDHFSWHDLGVIRAVFAETVREQTRGMSHKVRDYLRLRKTEPSCAGERLASPASSKKHSLP